MTKDEIIKRMERSTQLCVQYRKTNSLCMYCFCQLIAFYEVKRSCAAFLSGSNEIDCLEVKLKDVFIK